MKRASNASSQTCAPGQPAPRSKLSNGARRDIRRAAALANELNLHSFRTHVDGSIAAWSSPPAADTRRGTLGGSSRRFPSEAPVQSKKKKLLRRLRGVAENSCCRMMVVRLHGGRLRALGAPLGEGGAREQAHHRRRADVVSPASPESPGRSGLPRRQGHKGCFEQKERDLRVRGALVRAMRRSAAAEWIIWIGCASSCVRQVRACARSSGLGEAPRSDF